MPDIVERLSALCAEVVDTSPADFASYLKSEIEKRGKVTRDNNVKFD